MIPFHYFKILTEFQIGTKKQHKFRVCACAQFIVPHENDKTNLFIK